MYNYIYLYTESSARLTTSAISQATKDKLPRKGGPPLDINGDITPPSRVITPVVH